MADVEAGVGVGVEVSSASSSSSSSWWVGGFMWIWICRSRILGWILACVLVRIFFSLIYLSMFLGDPSFRRPHLVPIEFMKKYRPPLASRFRVTWYAVVIVALVLLILRSLAMAKIETTSLSEGDEKSRLINRSIPYDVGPRGAVSSRERGARPLPRVGS